MKTQEEIRSFVDTIRAAHRHPEAYRCIHKSWKSRHNKSNIASTGFCFVSAMVLYDFLGYEQSGYQLMKGPCPGGSHYWLQHSKTGDIQDPTWDQFEGGYDYEQGSFVNAKPLDGLPLVFKQVVYDMANSMQTILHVEHCDVEYFFDDEGKLLASWYCNDAMFRSEYMGPLFKNLGISIEDISHKDPRVFDYIKADLLAQGASEEDLE